MQHFLMLLWLLPGLQSCRQRICWLPLLTSLDMALYPGRGVVLHLVQREYDVLQHGCDCYRRTLLVGAILTNRLVGG